MTRNRTGWPIGVSPLGIVPSRIRRARASGSTARSRRRAEVFGVFPNGTAITGLVGAILLQQNDDGAVQRVRYGTPEAVPALGGWLLVGWSGGAT